jgi:SAM-dependent methyltransferase
MALRASEEIGKVHGSIAIAARKTQRDHWDNVARKMPDLFAAASTRYYRQCEMALIQRNFGALNGKRVLKLDLWNEAVNTRILQWMQSEGAEVFGLDISRVTTHRAYLNGPDSHRSMRVIQADIRNLPFEPDSFDFVYTMGTIEHINEYQEAVREIHRVLKPGGKTIIGVPHKWDLFLRPLLVRALALFERYPYSPERSFSAGELSLVVENAGLRVARRTGILSSPAIIRMADCFFYRRKIACHTLSSALLWPFAFFELRYPWLGRFGYLLALVAEKNASGSH